VNDKTAQRSPVYGVRCGDGVLHGHITTHRPNAEMRAHDADRGCICGSRQHAVIRGSVAWDANDADAPEFDK
jgi:hypothetical protein